MPEPQKRIKPLASSPAFRIVQYRNRAEELRVIADALVLESVLETLLRIAQTYDGLADQALLMANVS